MKKKTKLLGMILAVTVCMGIVAGCGSPGAKETSAQPTVITSEPTKEAAPAEATQTPEPTPTPTATPAPVTDIAQLQPKNEKFMQPKSLDGIDPLNDKVIALTFDDGPGPYTDQLLDTLKENDAVATFFVVGNRIAEYPGIVKRAYEEGNEIATHSYTHPEAKEWKALSADGQLEQYTQANDAIEKETGLRTLFDRPPGGNTPEEKAEQIGREQILWSVDPEDWNKKKGFRDADKVYDHVMNGTNGGGKATDGAVVLSHDIYQSTVDGYAKIIPELKEQGYRFVTVSQMMQIAKLRGEELKYIFNKAPAAGAGLESKAD